MKHFLFTFCVYLLFQGLLAQEHTLSKVWIPDNGNGTYKNPIIHADYSDPDAIRVGEDYYMTASSFNSSPALPILHSKDLVNWTIIGYALKHQKPLDVFVKPQHGNGVWAPAIRYHKGKFYIYYGDPDFGIYMLTTDNPAGTWQEPVLVKSAKGWIDPCPFWDEDGKAYLVHAFAGSRAGIKSILVLHQMTEDGTQLLDDGVMVFDGQITQPTLEGPKMYKRNGYYYIFAPAGGVPTGWQTVFRSKNILGPYEAKKVMEQGNTPINGPHQGAWVDTVTGEDWFIHFQDKGAYGRIVHLQPMQWKNDFPIIGTDKDNDRKGEPVLEYKKPNVEKTYPKNAPQTSDEFNRPALGLQWQWHANAEVTWGFPTSEGYMRLYAQLIPEGYKNLWDLSNLLLQKFTAPEFTATVKLTFQPHLDGDKIGLVIMGLDYAYLSITKKNGKWLVSQAICKDADKGTPEVLSKEMEVKNETLYLRVNVKQDAQCTFSFSQDAKTFTNIGESFKAREGKWIGAKVGLFCTRSAKTNDAGYADIDWFRIE